MNWYLITKTAAEMNPEVPTQWESDPSNPKWKQWQKFDRQRQFPFMSEHDRPFQRRYKDPAAKDYGFEEDAAPVAGGEVYHVTTNLSGIKIDGRLKSRSELKDTMGLGGGINNEAPRMISLTYDYNRALHLYEELHFVASVLRGKMSPSQIYKHFSSYMSSMLEPMEGELSRFDEVLMEHGVKKKMIFDGDEAAIGKVLDKRLVSPEQRYEFLQSLEKAIIEEESADNENADHPFQQSVIGFTTPFFNMKNLNPAQIAIVQCVLRKDADVEHVINEMEIRASPQDLAVVRFIQPNPGY